MDEDNDIFEMFLELMEQLDDTSGLQPTTWVTTPTAPPPLIVP